MENKWQRSQALLARAQKSLAGGVSSPFRAKFPVPLYFQDGTGCRLRDVDGNEYIDYALAWGPAILGYRHPRLTAAVERAAAGPHIYGEEHELEILVAEKIQSMVPCAERVAFTSSGSEAVQIMMRLTRAFTGRPLILKFEGHYHGWVDTALWSYHPDRAALGTQGSCPLLPGSAGQPMNTGQNIVARRWNNVALVEQAFQEYPGQIAGVMLEPVLCNSGCILPQPGYLEQLREICTRYGALLMFDEVITGFRIAPGGAQSFYGVTPDIATFGKAVGGGLPLSVIAGRREIMEQMFMGGVAFGGTFNGNPLSMAAANAALEAIDGDHGAAIRHANAMGEALMEGIRRIAAEQGVPLLVSGFGTAFAMHFTPRAELKEYRDLLDDDAAALQTFLRRMLEAGIHCLPDGRFYVSAVHGQAEVDATLKAVAASLPHKSA